MRVVVIGVGVMGLSAAAELSTRGTRWSRSTASTSDTGSRRRRVPPASSGWRTPTATSCAWPSGTTSCGSRLERDVGRPLRLHARAALARRADRRRRRGLGGRGCRARAASTRRDRRSSSPSCAGPATRPVVWQPEAGRCAPTTPCGPASPGCGGPVGALIGSCVVQSGGAARIGRRRGGRRRLRHADHAGSPTGSWSPQALGGAVARRRSASRCS